MEMIDRLCAWWLRRNGWTVIKGQTVFLGSPLVIGGDDTKWVSYENPRRLRVISVDPKNPLKSLWRNIEKLSKGMDAMKLYKTECELHQHVTIEELRKERDQAVKERTEALELILEIQTALYETKGGDDLAVRDMRILLKAEALLRKHGRL